MILGNGSFKNIDDWLIIYNISGRAWQNIINDVLVKFAKPKSSQSLSLALELRISVYS